VGADLSKICREAREKLLASSLRQVLKKDGTNAVWGNEIYLSDAFTGNGAQSRWSNAPGTTTYVGFITAGSDDSDLSDLVAYTSSNDTVTIDATDADSSATVGTRTPVAKWCSDGSAVVLTSAGWTGLGGGSATAVLDSTGTGYQGSGEFYIEFDVDMPSADALTKVPSQVHSAFIGSTACTVVYDEADLNLTEIATNGANGVLIDVATRGITAVVSRATITAGASATVAKAAGRIRATSGGTISGGLVTGLNNNQSVNVVYDITLTASQTLTVHYSYRPPPSPALPDTLSVRVIHMEDHMYASNLGTGGGTAGQPYLNPILHIPDRSTNTSDRVLNNNSHLALPGFGGNWGLLKMPVVFETPWDRLRSLSGPGTDDEGRPFYSVGEACSAWSGSLIAAQWHRTVRFGLAQVQADSGAFLAGEIILIGLTETANSVNNRVGIQGGTHVYAVGCWPIREVLYV